jgi:glycosyltransferase involved in cell wall biosynthesis
MATYFVDARSATPHFPGIGRYVTNLVTALAGEIAADEALQVLIPPREAQLRSQEQPWSDTLPERAKVQYLVSTASTFRLDQQWSLPRLIQQARQKQHGSALYHSPYYLMPYRTGLPNIVTLHDLIALLLPETVSLQARLLFRVTAFAALRASTHVIIGTESARQELLAHFSIDPSRVTTVPHAAAARFQPQPESAIQAVRASYQLPDEFLFYCGINKPHKNLVRLIDAYAALERTTPPLIIAGAWDDRYPESKQRAAELGLTEHVRFLGRVNDQDLPALYGAATLFVFPSLYEGFGLPVIEAMACGTPVACSDATGLRDVAGDAALLFDPKDTGSIVAVLRRAVENRSLLGELRTRSLAQAKRFSWSSTAQQTLAVYRHVLNQK